MSPLDQNLYDKADLLVGFEIVENPDVLEAQTVAIQAFNSYFKSRGIDTGDLIGKLSSQQRAIEFFALFCAPKIQKALAKLNIKSLQLTNVGETPLLDLSSGRLGPHVLYIPYGMDPDALQSRTLPLLSLLSEIPFQLSVETPYATGQLLLEPSLLPALEFLVAKKDEMPGSVLNILINQRKITDDEKPACRISLSDDLLSVEVPFGSPVDMQAAWDKMEEKRRPRNFLSRAGQAVGVFKPEEPPEKSFNERKNIAERVAKMIMEGRPYQFVTPDNRASEEFNAVSRGGEVIIIRVRAKKTAQNFPN